ncbi:MAG: ATP-binding protein [Draconibacterium sp.]|nr:ATP-binding protein [Draconibacterium sp.]
MKFEYKVTLIYLLIGGAWIIFSDKFLLTITGDQEMLTEFQTYKGWFYVATTSVLLYFLLKKHLKRLRKAESKAVKSNRLKTAFLQNISHEIRTPMNSIVGFSELLKSEELSETETKQYIKLINRSSYQLLNIVNDLLEISMIETGNIKLNEKNFHLNSFLDELISTFIPLVKKDINFSVTKGLDDESCTIRTDDHKLRQVLNNLLTNANKYTDKGNIELSYKIEDKSIKFSVKDTGIGISKELQSQVFNRFHKVHDEKERLYDGVGLGLAICKGNIDLLKGEIGVESEPDMGSTFYFTIPFQPVK